MEWSDVTDLLPWSGCAYVHQYQLKACSILHIVSIQNTQLSSPSLLVDAE